MGDERALAEERLDVLEAIFAGKIVDVFKQLRLGDADEGVLDSVMVRRIIIAVLLMRIANGIGY